jgi:hypothetical protein
MNQGDNHIVVRGAKIVVEYGVLDDGSMPARDFFETLAQEDQAYFLATFRHIAEYGISAFRDDRRFKQERTFWAARKDKCKHGPKGRKMVRIVCYRKRDEVTNRERLILTHGFWKPPKSEWPESEFGQAAQIRDEIDAREQR